MVVGTKSDDILKSIIHTKVMKKSQIVRLWFTCPETGKKSSRQTAYKTISYLLENEYLKKNALSVNADFVYRVTNKTIKLFRKEVDIRSFKTVSYKGLLLHQLLLAEAYVRFVEQGKTVEERRKLSTHPAWQDAQGDEFQVVESFPSHMKGVEKLADVFLGGAFRPKVFIEIDNDSKSPKRLEEDLIKWAFALNQKEREDNYRPPLVYLCASNEGAKRINGVFNKLSPHIQDQFFGFEAVNVTQTAPTLNKYLRFGPEERYH